MLLRVLVPLALALVAVVAAVDGASCERDIAQINDKNAAMEKRLELLEAKLLNSESSIFVCVVFALLFFSSYLSSSLSLSSSLPLFFSPSLLLFLASSLLLLSSSPFSNSTPPLPSPSHSHC